MTLPDRSLDVLRLALALLPFALAFYALGHRDHRIAKHLRLRSGRRLRRKA